MSEELAVIPKVDNVFLAARSSEEMEKSQTELGNWLETKLTAIRDEEKELKKAEKHARDCKWNYKALQAAGARARSRAVYYEKLLEATRAGYIMIPWTNYDSFAVRVVREEAKLLSSSSSWSTPSIPLQPSDKAPVGEGKYVSDASTGYSEKIKITKDGKQEDKYFSYSTDFKDVAFPIVAAKPMLMTATQHAMSMKIFDEIAIAPSRRGKDPLILGIVKGGKRGPICFLIAWYLDTAAL